jgi:peptidoglycan hydrolase-like protein with peptidoglycan-binding domain
MMTLAVVAAPLPLRPDPDENSAPVTTLEPSDVLTAILTLGAWSKISLTRSGNAFEGWLTSDNLVEFQAATVQLFDEPLGVARETVTGRVEIVTTVATWSKVKVTKADGSVSVGWTKAAPAPFRPSSPADARDDLSLGINERYRSALLEAQTITRIGAASLAALVDAEAGKIKGGPDAGVWDPKSTNVRSGAAGLTQFIETTWCEMACKAGSRLNAVGQQKALVTGNGQIAPGMKGALLDLRFDPTLSIDTAAEYGLANLALLQKDQLVRDDAGDDERAWFMYLAHHEGPAGAEQFLRKQGAVPFDKFVAQVGQDRAIELVSAAHGDVTLAYRNWLTSYIDQKIQPSRFRLARAPATMTAAAGARALGQLSADAAVPLSVLGGRLDLVLEIQQRLSDLGYLDPPADGRMGPTSDWALAEFCKLNRLSLGGGFTREIAQALLKPTALLPEIRPGDNWIDRALSFIRRQNWFVCRHPECKNIIYLEGANPDGSLNDNAPNVFNAIRVVFSIGANGAPVVHDWEGTTEPGTFWTFHPMNPLGAARIAFGQYKSWTVGVHHVGKRGAHEALIQVAPIDVYRDLNKDFKREGRVYTGIFGVNQHWGYDAPKNNLGNTSAGCLVGRTKAGHREFMALIKSDPRFAANHSYKFMTAVMAGSDALAASLGRSLPDAAGRVDEGQRVPA